VFLGRIDSQVKVRGHRIELEEIETAILRFNREKVAETVVVVGTDSAGEAQLVAYVLSPSTTNNELTRQLRLHCQSCLPLYMVPQAWVMIERWPLTLNGKIDRKALPPADFNQLDESFDYVAPQTELQQQLVDLCAEVLQLSKVSITANFFELGGNSLNATHFIALLCQQFGVDLSIRDFLTFSDLQAAGVYIEQHQAQQSQAQNLLADDSAEQADFEEFEL
jgi:acyl carrier protein